MVSKTKQNNAKTLSILIPFYNEEEAIPSLQSRLKPIIDRLKPKWKIQLILVDDGSIDSTHASLVNNFSALSSVQTIILRHSQNQGIGGAMRTGFEAATGDILCTLDSDCTYAPEKLPEMIALLLSSSADIVTGSPYHPLGRVENVDPRRLLLSKTASIMYSFLVPTKLHCYTSFFRAYRREWARTDFFQSSGFLAVTEVLLSAANSGARIIEFPVSMGARATGHSKMKVAKVTFDHLQLMSRTAIQSVFSGANRRHHMPARDFASPYPVAGANGRSTDPNDGANLLRDWVLVGRTEYRPDGSVRGKVMPGA